MTRTALITGASAGLGFEFARQLAAQGYDLVLVARREHKLEEVAQGLRTAFPSATIRTLAADLSEPEAPADIQQRCQDLAIEVDYLVNNAGAAGPGLLSDVPWPEQQRYLRLMMTSVTELCHRFVPGMAQRGFGRVVNVASVAGRIATRGDCHYGPSKAYLIALSEVLALTVKPQGVHVSVLCPGFTHTDFHEVAGMLDMKRSLPSWIWYDAEVVVREGLLAVERGQAIKLSGRVYRWIDPLLQSVIFRPLIKAFGPAPLDDR